MFYNNILHDDMRNGDGLRVTLFVSGCNHQCYNCQNPQTWDCNSGIEFDLAAKEEIFEQLNKEYINGITFSGGDPLHSNNLHDIYCLITEIKEKYPDKTIWIYTGFDYDFLKESDFSEDKFRMAIINLCNVLIDGKYIDKLSDVNYHWAGSTNQRIIDIQQSIEKGEIVLWDN